MFYIAVQHDTTFHIYFYSNIMRITVPVAVIEQNQHTRELISTQKTLHKHIKDQSHLW